MAANSKIEWTHHTFNPWRGCCHVSPGCEHCYAETLAKRNPGILGTWGASGERVIASETYWRQPDAWNRAAEKVGERHRVFCASLADVFEDRLELHAPRLRLLDLIRRTPVLDWLLLTKRPENVRRLLAFAVERPDCVERWRGYEHSSETADWVKRWILGEPPANVWLGVSVEDQRRADERIPLLLQMPAAVRFLSCEPLLGPVDLQKWLCPMCPGCHGSGVRSGFYSSSDNSGPCDDCDGTGDVQGFVPEIDWVIVGGESGPHAQPMHPDWARSLRDQCQAAGVAFHFNQWGEWAPGRWYSDSESLPTVNCGDKTFSMEEMFKDDDDAIAGWMKKNFLQLTRRASWCDPLTHYDGQCMVRVGKHAAGRLLDGREWDEFPSV